MSKGAEIDVEGVGINPTVDIALGRIPRDGQADRQGVLVELKDERGVQMRLFHDSPGSAAIMVGAYLEAERYLEVMAEEGYDRAVERFEEAVAQEAEVFDNFDWDD